MKGGGDEKMEKSYSTFRSGFCVSLHWLPCSTNSKESSYEAEDQGSIPGLGSSSGERNDDPLQFSCLENSMDREAWRTTVRGVAESATTERLTHTHTHTHTQRHRSVSGFPFVSYLFSQAMEGSRFLPSSVSWEWHLDSINTIWSVSYPETRTHLHLDCKIISCSTLLASVTARSETDLFSEANWL